MRKVIIIGGGLGGLATAALLAKDGYKVTVLEKNDQVGGRAGFLKEHGFFFDIGPSWYMMPEVFENFWRIFGKKIDDYFKLVRLDPRFRVYFGKNDFIDLTDDIKENIKLFESIEAGSGAKLDKFLGIAKSLYTAATEKLVYENIESPWSLLDIKKIIPGLRILSTANIFQPLDKFVSKFVTNDRLKKILEFSTVFLGSSPYNLPAFYSLVDYADFGLGIWYPSGGIYQLPLAIAKIAVEMGAKIQTGAEVTQIITDGGKVRGVMTKNGKIDADIVVANADYQYVETKMLNSKYQTYPPEYWEKKTVAISAFMMFVGIKGKLPKLLTHTFFFGADWPKGFREVFSSPQWQTDPSYYVSSPSRFDLKMAPKNCENLVFLVPMAPGLNDNDQIRESYAKKILNHFEESIGEKITDRIITRTIFSQRDFRERFHAYRGTALGLAHTMDQSLFMRPKIKSPKVKNLYYVGQYTQPGIGMPLVVISAQIVAAEIAKAEKKDSNTN